MKIYGTYYFLLCFLLSSVIFVACKQTKYVPQGSYLLKKNTIILPKNSDLVEDDVSEIIRQQPNFKTIGVKLKLAAFNAIDSAKVSNKRIIKNQELIEKNAKLLVKQHRINEKRIKRAERKDREWYTKKVIPLKDTIEPKRFFREWLKYKFGEAPVIFNSVKYAGSIEQLEAFLKKKGYYYGNITDSLVYNRNKTKVTPHYFINTGPRYYIDSVFLIGSIGTVESSYNSFIRKEKIESLKGKPFDLDMLDNYRSQIAELMRDDTYFGFSFSNVDFSADTMMGNFKVAIGIHFGDRVIKSLDYPDSVIQIPFVSNKIRNAYFHILDTNNYKGSFHQKLQSLGLDPTRNGYMTTIDTFEFKEIYFNRDEKRNRGLDPSIDTLNINRIATFYYNGRMFVKPGIIELQNYLEKGNYYREYYLERSYTRLLQLGVFSFVKPVLKEVEGTNLLDVHYYLVPAKKQAFSFEPKATTSNGFLGASASINYANKNLFRGAQNLTFSISGGFESQPPIFDDAVDGSKIKKAGRSFNTFEIGPSLKLDIPGLLPLKRGIYMSKRQRARTITSIAYNFQNRTDFTRKNFTFNYLWKFYGGETQIFQIGLPTTSVVKYVNITKSVDFESKISALNDVFLRNAYSDQFVWQDWKVTYEYNTTDKKNKKTNAVFYYKTSFDPAGNLLSLFNKSFDTTSTGQYAIFGLGYSQFLRLDNEIIFAQPINKKSSFNSHLLFGGGVPYGNSKTSLPYDYSFFGGGANDNRGWRARSLGPGIYKYYLDEGRTATQIGDLRLGLSVEYRFSLGGVFKGAVFSDAGNIWTKNEDINRPGSQFSIDFYKQLAYSVGLGLRVDLDFFIIRLDLGLPLSNPSLPAGSRWIFQSRDAFNQELQSYPDLDLSKVPKPFTPILHFGIGYPF